MAASQRRMLAPLAWLAVLRPSRTGQGVGADGWGGVDIGEVAASGVGPSADDDDGFGGVVVVGVEVEHVADGCGRFEACLSASPGAAGFTA